MKALQGRPAAGTGPARCDHGAGDRPARPGADSGRLSARRAHPTDAVQAHCQRRRLRGTARTAGGNDRPLRPAAGAGTRNLFAVTELKLKATPLGIRKIDVGAEHGRLVFGSQPNVDPRSIIQLLQSEPNHYSLDGSDKVRFHFDMAEAGNRIAAASQLLDRLSIRTD